jgi:carboxymethylenebutenolidase
VVAYYGAPPTDPTAIARIKAPVLGNYGGDDKGPSPDQVKAFEDGMKKAGKSIDIKIYPGAPHAFANPNNPWKGYREDAARDAWARTIAFFNKHLKS